MYFQSLLIRGLIVIYPLALRMFFWIAGYEKIALGKVVFWGPKLFSKTVCAVIELLTQKDPRIVHRLECTSAVFWYSPRATFQVGRAFAIGQEYLEWQKEGVLTFVIVFLKKHELLAEELFSLPRSPAATEQIRVAHGNAARWLELEGVNQELVAAVRNAV